MYRNLLGVIRVSISSLCALGKFSPRRKNMLRFLNTRKLCFFKTTEIRQARQYPTEFFKNRQISAAESAQISPSASMNL